jgi:iron complex outermembrane recepter protein
MMHTCHAGKNIQHMQTVYKLFLLSLITKTISAQDTVRGRVYDKETGEALAGVTFFIPGTAQAVLSNAAGHFTLAGNLQDSIHARMIGYNSYTFIKTARASIALKPTASAMQEIVVTAGRGKQERSEAPMAIEKISAGVISDTKATLLSEVINKVPGVVMLNLNNEQHGMSIRQPMGTSPYYLYMEDGIPLRTMGVFNHNALIEMNLFAVSSIEVVKGPASSLYGPEAVGGAINFISQRPTAHTTVKAGIHADNFGYRRFQYGSGGMMTRKAGYYIGGYYAQQRNGWMNYSDYDKNSLNARLDYDLTERTKITLSGAYNDYFSQTPGSVDSIAFYARSYSSSSRFTYRAVNSKRARLSMNHQWNQRHTSLLHLFYRDNSIAQNPSYGIRWTKGMSTARGEINNNASRSKGFIAQHTALLPRLRSKITGGGSFDHSPVAYHAHQVDLSALLRSGGASVEEYTILAERPDIVLADYQATLFNSAAFIQAEIKPVRNLNITVGGRYDILRFRYHNFIDDQQGNKTFLQFSPKTGATYKINNRAGLYTNYSLGFSPPSLSTIFTRRTGSAEFYYDLEPAQFNNYEGGSWMNFFNNKLEATITIYQMNGKNELLNVRQPDNSTDYQSAGRTLHRGLEYSISYRPLRELQLRAGGTSALHRYEEFILSNRHTDQVQHVNGMIMPSAPSQVLNAEIMYRPRFLKGLKAGLEWQYLSSWYQNQVNAVQYEETGAFGLQGVSVLHFRTAYEFRGFEIFVNIMNLTDELYAYNATRGNSSFHTSTYTPAPPRTFVFGLQYHFTAKNK